MQYNNGNRAVFLAVILFVILLATVYQSQSVVKKLRDDLNTIETKCKANSLVVINNAFYTCHAYKAQS